MSLGIGDGIGLDRCECEGACMCVFSGYIYPCLCVVKCGSGIESLCPHIAQSDMASDTETERLNDCLVKRLTAPEPDFVMQFSVAA